MTITEEDVHIVTYLTPTPPLRGVVKQRYADFVVNEVGIDGRVAELTSLSAADATTANGATPDAAAVAAGASIVRGGGGGGDAEAAWATLTAALPAAAAADLRAYNERLAPGAPPPADGAVPTFYLPPMADKATRRSVHTALKAALPRAIADTVPAAEAVAAAGGGAPAATGGSIIRLRSRGHCTPWKRKVADGEEEGGGRGGGGGGRGGAASTRGGGGRSAKRPRGGGAGGSGGGGRSDAAATSAASATTYDPREHHRRSTHVGRTTLVAFVLWKENVDTGDALASLGHLLRLPAAQLGFAGTKDKRAVTAQWVTVRGVPPSRLGALNGGITRRGRGGRRMAVGNFVVGGRGGRPLGLGVLAGNRFTVVLRDVSVETGGGGRDGARATASSEPAAVAAAVGAAVDGLRARGFVNYFGLQRFGTGTVPTHAVGWWLLRRRWREAVLAARRADLLASLREPAVVSFGEKVAFMLGLTLLMATEGVLLVAPARMWAWYAALIGPLLATRVVLYRANNFGYFMYDFCYAAQLLLLGHLFLYPTSGPLFRVNFAVANGPLAWAVILWRNSLVFHSLDRLTSLAVHFLPPLVTFCLRWYGDGRGGGLAGSVPPGAAASSYGETGVDGWHDHAVYAIGLPLGVYAAWQAAYLVKTEVISRTKLVGDPELMTSLRWLTRHPGGIFYRAINVFGPKHHVATFVLLQGVYTLLTLAASVLLYESQLAHAVFLGGLFAVAAFNGASFYFEVVRPSGGGDAGGGGGGGRGRGKGKGKGKARSKSRGGGGESTANGGGGRKHHHHQSD